MTALTKRPSHVGEGEEEEVAATDCEGKGSGQVRLEPARRERLTGIDGPDSREGEDEVDHWSEKRSRQLPDRGPKARFRRRRIAESEVRVSESGGDSHPKPNEQRRASRFE